MIKHFVFFYGSTKIITGHNSLKENVIKQRNQIIGFDGIDINPELVELGEKCFNAKNPKGGIGETGTLYPDNKTIVPFRYLYKEDLIVNHLEDVISANEEYIKADSIIFPLMSLKEATIEGFDQLGKDFSFKQQEEIDFKNKWCCFGHYYLNLLKLALHKKGYTTTEQSHNLINVEFIGPNRKKLLIHADAGL
jgi:hypothetical protein